MKISLWIGWLLTILAAPVTVRSETNAPPPFEQGVQLLQNRRYQSAAEAFERAAALAPKSFEAHLNWGIALVQTAQQFNEPEPRRLRLEQAAEKFQTAADLKPQERIVYVMWSETLVQLANLLTEPESRQRTYRAAIEKCRRATELAPAEWDAYHKWGVILAGKLAEFAPDPPARLKLYHDAAELFGKAADRASFRPDKAAAFANWGEALVQEAHSTAAPAQQQELLRTALEKFAAAAQLQPRAATTYAMWGSALLDVGKLSGSRTDFRAAADKLKESLALNPNEPAVLYRLACAYALMENRVFAIQNLQRCFKLDRTGSYRDSARRDPDLSNLRDDPEFKNLLP